MDTTITTMTIDSLSIAKLHLDKMNGEEVPTELFTFDNHLPDIFWGGIGSMILYVAAMGMMAILLYKKEKILNFCERHLSIGFVVVWLMGFVVYDIGMYPEHETDGPSAILTLLGVAPMAIVHAFEMFIFQSDISAIHEECHNNGWFMFFFSITHLAAALISLVFVIKHFGFNIVANIIRYWRTYVNVKKAENLYVFWGFNDATYFLAKDIMNQRSDKDTVVIVRMDNDKEERKGPLGMERLFNFLSMTKRDLENLLKLQKMGCLTVNTFGSVTNPPPPTANDNLLHELKLDSIAKLMSHARDTVHMFFLENDEVFNIEALANLKKDSNILSCADKHKVKLYCHARQNTIHKVIENEQTHENIFVKLVDSSHISVEQLKQNADLHPVNFVDVKKDATVASPFHALVVGFGEVGMDITRFLYEFGAFVKHGNDKNNVERSVFRCHVVDKNIDELAGLFTANTPNIKVTLNEGSPYNYKEINLHNLDCQSIEFYEHLKDWIKTLNYVVVATESDEMNISLAVRVMRLAIRYRENLDRLAIVVRVRHDENGHIQKIADHYNRLWAADLARPDKKKDIGQKKVSSKQEVSSPITLFGQTDKTYTYKHIVSDELIETAKIYKRKYDLTANAIKKYSGVKPDRIETWDDERNRFMQLTGENKGYSPTFSGLMRLRRMQAQNICNSLHAETKKRLADLAIKGMLEIIKKHGLVRKDQCLTYEWRDRANLDIDSIQRVLDVLAQTEHLRWVASHEILGYIDYGTEKDKDEARLWHGCMKDWQNLSESVQSYDYNVVDVSLDIWVDAETGV